MKSSKHTPARHRNFPYNEIAELGFIKQRWHDCVEYPLCKSKMVSEKKEENEHTVAMVAVEILAPNRVH